MERTAIIIEATINAPVEKVWGKFTSPEDIMHWNNASADWHTPHAENDLRVGGKFVSKMEAKDGSFGFEFSGEYNQVKEHELIEYTLIDGRKVTIKFTSTGNETKVEETFEAETTHPEDVQRTGWQAILDSFKKYVEAN